MAGRSCAVGECRPHPGSYVVVYGNRGLRFMIYSRRPATSCSVALPGTGLWAPGFGFCDGRVGNLGPRVRVFRGFAVEFRAPWTTSSATVHVELPSPCPVGPSRRLRQHRSSAFGRNPRNKEWRRHAAPSWDACRRTD